MFLGKTSKNHPGKESLLLSPGKIFGFKCELCMCNQKMKTYVGGSPKRRCLYFIEINFRMLYARFKNNECMYPCKDCKLNRSFILYYVLINIDNT